MKAFVNVIGDDKELLVNIVKMTGRIYKAGKNEKGKFIDTVGEPDNRYQVYAELGYDYPHKVFNDKESIKKNFVLTPSNTNPDIIAFFS